ncbi:iron uptake transporter deferrochelatase/peroxidase subunit [Kineococcus gypseus]|uniref:iron uptake transporter deferrochelatase/peroxidase subunit n=1 Tax=Kineococcus gypseus TaxID=1637102 RepID=UPI003D7C66DE
MAAGRGALSRRGLIAALGAGAGGVGAAALVGAAASGDAPAARDEVVPFEGEHQAGVSTDVQAHLHFAAFDVLAADREELAGLLRDWTRAARSLTAGRPVGESGAVGGDPLAPPEDTGEALGLPAARLTLTLGLGPSLFDDRFGLAGRRPEALVDLPPFPGDALEAARCGGDLAVQACADDPQVAVHAVRTLSRIAAGRAAVRWAQLGYGRAATVDPGAPTPRNLFGFKDGTANVAGDDTGELDEHVWVGAQDAAAPEQAWMTGGTYLVARRIAMHVETWDRSSLAEQEQVIGRTKGEGAPLGGRREHEGFDPATLPATSHVRLAHPSRHGGARMLRRGYNYTDGATALGRLDAGLFFLAYQRDVRRAFVPVQRALAADDALNEYVRHTGSGVWAVPPGVGADGWWGEPLLG